jgi:S-DNA-T family DNA segregation ATPase FtsK/SpoIIIE
VKRRLESPGAGGEPIFLLIQGLHRARDLRPDPDAYYSSAGAPSTPADCLAQILRDGPEVGAHVLAWCDTVTNARRVLDRALGEFGMRLAGAMSMEESSLFLDCGDASRLDRPHRLLFCDEDRPGVIQKLRPYALPDLEWVESIAARQRRWQHE